MRISENQRLNKVVEDFSKSCEEMNGYALKLRNAERFQRVITGADIRQHLSGWRLQKWIEAEIDAKSGLYLAWWLELSFANEKWCVSGDVSITNGNFSKGISEERTNALEEVAGCLSKITSQLFSALNQEAELIRELETMRQP